MNKRKNISFFFSLLVIAMMTAYIIKGDIFTTSTYTDVVTIKSDITEIIIKKPASEIKLTKKDGKWLVGANSYSADQELMRTIEKEIKSLKISDHISNGEYASKYDLDADRAVELKITFANNVQKSISAGKKSSTNKHIYIKMDGRPDVYLAAGNIDSVVLKNEDDFRNREIVKIPPDAVSSFEITSRGRKFSFIKKSEEKNEKITAPDGTPSADERKIKTDSWSCSGYDNIKLDTNSVTALISDFNPLRAASYIYDSVKFTNPAVTVKIKSGGKEFELAIFDKVRDKYPAKSSDSEYFFNLDDFIVKKLLLENIDTLKSVNK